MVTFFFFQGKEEDSGKMTRMERATPLSSVHHYKEVFKLVLEGCDKLLSTKPKATSN